MSILSILTQRFFLLFGAFDSQESDGNESDFDPELNRNIRKINPFTIPNIVQILSKYASRRELLICRRFSKTFFKIWSPIYWDRMGKSFIINTRHITSRVIVGYYTSIDLSLQKSIPLEFLHLYRRLIILDLEFMNRNSRNNELIDLIRNIAPNIHTLEITIDNKAYKSTHLRSPFAAFRIKNNPKLLVSMLEEVGERFQHLKNIKIVDFYNLNFQIIKKALDLLKVQPHLHFVVTDDTSSNFIGVSKTYLLKNSTMSIKYFAIETETELEAMAFKSTQSAQCLQIYQIDLRLNKDNFRDRENIIVHFKQFMSSLKGNTNIELNISLPKRLENHLFGGNFFDDTTTNWKLNITKLQLCGYSGSLGFLFNFSSLSSLKLDNINEQKCLFPEPYLTDEENLRRIFESLSNVRVLLWYGYGFDEQFRKIRQGNSLRLYIASLVLELIVW